MKKEPKISAAVTDYIALETERHAILVRHRGQPSIEEDVHAEAMDKAWAKLSEGDVKYLKSRPKVSM